MRRPAYSTSAALIMAETTAKSGEEFVRSASHINPRAQSEKDRKRTDAFWANDALFGVIVLLVLSCGWVTKSQPHYSASDGQVCVCLCTYTQDITMCVC